MNYKLAKKYAFAFLNPFCSTFLYGHCKHVYCGINAFGSLLISSFMSVYGPPYDHHMIQAKQELQNLVSKEETYIY